MEDDLSEKQTFLRENILEKGYDAEDFMKYLQTKKGELGLDLGGWSINELHEEVKEFTKENSGIEDEKEEENINKEHNNNEIYDLIFW